VLTSCSGTGKTQLARVLAHESNTVMICASAADIENKYIGETPQAIRGLFNLGRMLAPSIVFIDEADSLFQGRSSEDKPWHRARLNQLLHEMDGISKNRSTPFVVLSTNLPGDLDDAVLRRIPCRLHIGLPYIKSRVNIFKICLQGEMLHENVDLEVLARKTPRYSGSDIEALCMQAAMVCDEFIASGENQGVRVLGMSHFIKALGRTAPTVSQEVVWEIGAFAKQYDPAAYERSLLVEAREAELLASV
jgi:SpoVK/Ycf46/Vps4 family AAA+-type ATPase